MPSSQIDSPYAAATLEEAHAAATEKAAEVAKAAQEAHAAGSAKAAEVAKQAQAAAEEIGNTGSIDHSPDRQSRPLWRGP